MYRACTLGCSDPEWDDGNTIFNFFKMLELTYKFTTEQLYDYFMLENNPKGATKRGRYGAQKSSASDQRIFISKQNYAGVPVDQQRDALRKFHEENPNMFMPADEPNHTIIPQVPAMMHQTYGDFELVSGLSFDQILDDMQQDQMDDFYQRYMDDGPEKGGGGGKSKSDIRASDKITKIYGCATMWHETKEEMMEMLKSIFRIDKDYSARRLAQKYLQIVDPDYYEWETHILFDDAFELGDNDEEEQIVSD